MVWPTFLLQTAPILIPKLPSSNCCFRSLQWCSIGFILLATSEPFCFQPFQEFFLQVFMDICLADPWPLMQAELSDAGHGASSFTIRHVEKCPSQQLLRALQSENRQNLQLDKGSIFCSLILQFLSVQQGICVKHQTILVNKFQQNDQTLIIHSVH